MKSRLPIVLLLLIHVPFLIGYAFGLRTDTAYQFGPVVWGIVALLFWRRTGGRMESKGRFPLIHFMADAVCLALAVVTGEFGFGVLGGLVWGHAFLKRYQDKAVHSSLGYLCFPLLFSIRPPVVAFDSVLEQLIRQANGLASQFLDLFHYLHFTTSNSIEVSGHSFDIQQVCDVLLSAPALLCLACVFQCVLRRRWAHAIPSLLASVFVALLMQATRLCVTVVIWQEYGTDASLGVDRLILSLSVFVIGLLSIISLDALLSGFTEPIPLMATATMNPFAVLWNKLFLTLPRNDLEPVQETDGREVMSILEQAPSVLGMLGPWAGDLLHSWFMTRSPRRFLIGLPCAVLCIATIPLWTNTDTSAKLNGRYEAALTEAVARNHEVDLELALQRLQQNNVDTFAVQFKWVQNLIPRGETEQAVPRLNAMTPLDGPGYSAVRIWLVKQSEKPDALIPLSDQERQQQLQKAVQEQSRNPEAHLLLGESYLRQRQTRLAEHHFATASELDPNNAPDMLALQKILGRRRQELLLQSASAMQILQDRLSADQGDHQARISIARIMAILGDNKQAESLLKDGLAIEESAEMKNALSAVYAATAIELLRKALNQRHAVELARQAVQLNPSNMSAIQLLFRTVKPPDRIDPNTLRPALDHWRQHLEQDGNSIQTRQHLIELLTVCGLFEEAIEVLKPVAAANRDSQANLAQLLVLAGKTDEAREVTDTLLKQLRSEESDNEQLVVSVARVLLIENRLQEVVQLLETQINRANGTPGVELTGIYVKSVHALFDRKAAADDSFIGTNESLDLLQRVYRINPAASAIAPRLARVAIGQGVATPEANALVSEILAQGTLNAAVYSAVGAEAILQKDFEKAVTNLEQAHSLLPDDPVALNNLAVALVRRSKGNAVRALDLVEQALLIAPGHPDLLATRGEIYIALDRLTDARHDLSAVLEIDPQHELALQLLAGIEE